MSRIPLLPRWVLPSVTSIYDLESATLSEMVPKLYGTMRELVNNYNDFADELNEEIKNFTGSTSEEIANFKKAIEQRLICKFNDIDAQLSKMQLNMKQYTDTTLSRAFDVFGVTVKAAGEDLILTDATDEEIRGLSIYGKTTQSWDPVPEYPAALQSVGDAGSVTVKITNGTDEQLLTIATPEGLPGIPVTEGGNYTDATGQRWICDEIDLKRGVYVQRIGKMLFDGSEKWDTINSSGNIKRFRNDLLAQKITPVAKSSEKAKMMCTAFKTLAADITFLQNEGISLEVTNAISVYHEASNGDLQAWKNYLNTNSVTLIYALAEPVERPLTAAELAAYKQLHTYHMKDTTVTTDSGAGILLEYVAITQLYLENRIHDIAVQITTEKINEAIRNGEIVVGLEYNEETEEANIVGGAG